MRPQQTTGKTIHKAHTSHHTVYSSQLHDIVLTAMTRTTVIRDPTDMKKMNNLGRVQLRHVDSNQIILIPTPTNDPNGRHCAATGERNG